MGVTTLISNTRNSTLFAMRCYTHLLSLREGFREELPEDLPQRILQVGILQKKNNDNEYTDYCIALSNLP